MKAEHTIRVMRDQLQDSIFETGWDPLLEGAYTALAWVFSDDFSGYHDDLLRFMETPEAERRRIWVAYGGNPDEWEVGT